MAILLSRFSALALLSVFAGSTLYTPAGGTQPAVQAPAAALEPVPGAFAPYLSGLVAQNRGDHTDALNFYQQALQSDPRDPGLQQRVFSLALAAGRFDIAMPLARRIVAREPSASLAGLTLMVDALKSGDAKGAHERAKALDDQGFLRYVRGFAQGWSALAAKIPVKAALDEVAAAGDVRALGALNDLQLALIADVGGDKVGAGEHYDAAMRASGNSLRLAELAANYYSRTGQHDRAQQLADRIAASVGGATEQSAKIGLLTVPAPLIQSPQDGLAETLFELAGLMAQDAATDTSLFTIRLSLLLRPDYPPAQLVLAEALSAVKEPQEAIAALRSIPEASSYGRIARLREAYLLDQTGATDAATRLLQALAAQKPNQIDALVALANQMRSHDRFHDAALLYTAALGRLENPTDQRWWILYYDRGVSYERDGDWAKAQPDLRYAAAHAPEEAEVLNYLGYALVDRNEKLDEALDLIDRAVKLKPDDGYYVDSLGWSYYRQGKFDEACRTLERAVELKPGDADINAHLGDAYFANNKLSDARLQWRRALSLKPSASLAQQLTDKLDKHASPGTQDHAAALPGPEAAPAHP